MPASVILSHLFLHRVIFIKNTKKCKKSEKYVYTSSFKARQRFKTYSSANNTANVATESTAASESGSNEEKNEDKGEASEIPTGNQQE